jgi:methionyl aminopeptidase
MELDNWKKAGNIARESLVYGKSIIKPGLSFLEVADKIEEKIKSLGGEPAFPVNLSHNEFASHFVPKKNEELIFEDQVINLDVGVHVNGCIGDNATTVDLSNKYKDLKKSAEDALKAVEKLLSQEVTLGQIGRTVQETIEGFGYKPIANLSGHNLDEFQVHAGISIPNIDTGDDSYLPDGIVIAVEPFATEGSGLVKESSNPQIYHQMKTGNVRGNFGRQVLKELPQFQGLPFAKRWLQTKGAELGVRELERANILKTYPPLVDVDKKITVQEENTYYYHAEGYDVLTK